MRNAEHGNYFASRITQVTHVENQGVDLMLDPIDLPEQELDEYVVSYQAEGWQLHSTKPRWDAARSEDPEGTT